MKQAIGRYSRDFIAIIILNFFFAKLLPQTDALFTTIQAGSETLMAVEADAF